MIKTGLWLELEASIGFIVGLGLGSLIGQRTVAVVLMIVLEVVLTPIVFRAHIPHFDQPATRRRRRRHRPPRTRQTPLCSAAAAAGPEGAAETPSSCPSPPSSPVCVVIGWLVGWTILGAWRMMTRDA